MDAAVDLSQDEGISLSAFLLELVQTINSDRLEQSRHAGRGDDSLREPNGAMFRRRFTVIHPAKPVGAVRIGI
jgi:hypothetical protein